MGIRPRLAPLGSPPVERKVYPFAEVVSGPVRLGGEEVVIVRKSTLGRCAELASEVVAGRSRKSPLARRLEGGYETLQAAEIRHFIEGRKS